MFTRKLALIAAVLGSAVGTSAAVGATRDDSGMWMQIADGVYERIGSDGTIYRDSVGDGGARYELALWKSKLTDAQRAGAASLEYVSFLRKQIADIEEYLASSKPGAEPDSIVAFNNPPNIFCGYVAHQLSDAYHLSNPGGGPSGAVSSIVYMDLTANSATPTANFNVMATITPFGSSPWTVSGSASISYTSPAGDAFLLTRNTGPRGGAFSATYSTVSSVSVPSCAGGFNQFNESGTVN
jgi:hypothetical protein